MGGRAGVEMGRPDMSPIPFAEIRAWMFEQALPYWGGRGVDSEAGGFHEELGLDGAATDIAFKRTRVICRQIYVFSHAAILGWAPGAILSARGFDYLVAKAWLGPEQGWAGRLSRAGAVIDATPDLYDLAFVLFALAWRYKLAREPEVLRYAHLTLDFIRARMRPDEGEGFLHKLPPSGPRLQNPHMHLLEAALAAFTATDDARFLDLADELVGLFRARLFDGRVLREHFTADWAPMPGAQGRQAEPGHHFEWAWILAQYQHIKATDMAREAAALVDFAERFGVDPATQATFDQVRDDGAPLRQSSRTWPNTERIKGHLALFELLARDPRAPVAGSARLLLDRYLAVSPRGAWIDQFDARGAPLTKAAPASTLYHLFLAFAEILRLETALTQTP